MANTLKKSKGNCVIGVADNADSAQKHKEKYKSTALQYSNFYITGVNSESIQYYGSVDKYFTKIVNIIKNEPISERDKDNILRNISVVNYFDKTVIILIIESGDIPSVYNKKYFVRHGSNISEVSPENFSNLFSRFQ